MSRARRGSAVAVLLALVIASMVAAPVPATAQARAAAGAEGAAIDRGRALYQEGRFQDAIELLRDAIQNGRLDDDDMARARELLARAMVKAGRTAEAREQFKSLLLRSPLYHPDPVAVPPDELEVFDQAKKEYDAERLEQGLRIPASVGFHFGAGSATNQDVVDFVESQGFRMSDFSEKTEFGGSVRLPIRPRWSVDIELSRLHATAHDDVTTVDHSIYDASALPLVASVVYTVIARTNWRLNGFAGVGPMLVSQIVPQFTHEHTTTLLVPVQIVGQSTGRYAGAGVEGEWRIIPRLSIAGRVTGRYANASDFKWKDQTYEIYQNTIALSDAAPLSRIKSIDFSGIGASIGVRAYIGY
jgi:tetratricopeptide (TPR) repeat protein